MRGWDDDSDREANLDAEEMERLDDPNELTD
jgi:hypothetical protein